MRSQRINALGFFSKVKKTTSAENANLKVKQLLSFYGHAQFLDFSNTKLFDSAPFYKSELIYMDASHLNEIGAAAYASEVKDEFFKIISPL